MSANMSTALTEVLGLAVPVIAAPMAKASENALAAAAAQAGALGCIGAGYLSPQRVSELYKAAAQQVAEGNRQHSALGIGVFSYSCSQVNQLCTHCSPQKQTSSVSNMVHPVVGTPANLY